MRDICYSVMGVKVDKVSKFAVDNPLQEAVAVFELDAEDSMRIVKGIHRICYAEFDIVEKDRDLHMRRISESLL